MPQPGDHCLLTTFWEAKSTQQKSPTEPYASSEWCLMKLLEAILRVDGPVSLRGSGLFRCVAGACGFTCTLNQGGARGDGVADKGSVFFLSQERKQQLRDLQMPPEQGHILVSQELQRGAEPRWSSGKGN